MKAIVGSKEEESTGNTRTAQFLTGSAGLGYFLLLAVLQMWLNMKDVRSYVLLTVPFVALMVISTIYYQLNGEGLRVDGHVLGAAYIAVAAISQGVLGFSAMTEWQDLNRSSAPLSFAAARAVHTLQEGGEMQK